MASTNCVAVIYEVCGVLFSLFLIFISVFWLLVFCCFVYICDQLLSRQACLCMCLGHLYTYVCTYVTIYKHNHTHTHTWASIFHSFLSSRKGSINSTFCFSPAAGTFPDISPSQVAGAKSPLGTANSQTNKAQIQLLRSKYTNENQVKLKIIFSDLHNKKKIVFINSKK